MKLRNIILAAVAVTACSSAFAADTGAMAQGGTYLGLAGGWGGLTKDQQLARDFINASGTRGEAGGFSGRVYLGYLMSMNTASGWMFGPELGYSYYANNTNTVYGYPDHDSNLNLKQSGYGVDLLLNATYMLSNTFNVAVKPGFQYAFEKIADSDNGAKTGFAGSTSDSRVLPEVNLGVNWQAFADKPFFLGASYQYVWGTDGASGNTGKFVQYGETSVSSRDMFALNLEYMFH